MTWPHTIVNIHFARFKSLHWTGTCVYIWERTHCVWITSTKVKGSCVILLQVWRDGWRSSKITAEMREAIFLEALIDSILLHAKLFFAHAPKHQAWNHAVHVMKSCCTCDWNIFRFYVCMQWLTLCTHYTLSHSTTVLWIWNIYKLYIDGYCM